MNSSKPKNASVPAKPSGIQGPATKASVNQVETKTEKSVNQGEPAAESSSSPMVPRLAMGLVHHPILDRLKKVVATNVTNFDIHDIARAARVYGVEKYYIIHPLKEQLMFVDRILDHWRIGEGSKFNPFRKTALTMVETAESIESAIRQYTEHCQKTDPMPKTVRPFTIATHARAVPGVKTYTFQELHQKIREPGAPPCLLLFGTGFGMTEEFMQSCDGVLESIRGAPPLDYRHLSVRSAVSICLDRVMGPW